MCHHHKFLDQKYMEPIHPLILLLIDTVPEEDTVEDCCLLGCDVM
jgi:hypothetical protein